MSPVIGTPLDRVDGRLKVTGAARYTAEVPVENLTHGMLVLSTIANGRVAGIDTSAAEAAPGVIGVLTHQTMPRFAGTSPIFPAGQTFLPMQDDVIHYHGQPVALVVAETLEQAQRAATLVAIDYVEETPVATLEDGLDQAFEPTGEFFAPPAVTRGDPDHGIVESDVRIEQIYTTAIKHANPLEPAATIALWEGDQLTLYESTQSISPTRQFIATVLGMAPEDVRVVSHFLGGGFGGKANIWPHTALAAVAAREVGRPVKLVLTRAQSYTSNGFQTATHQRLTLGATRDGRLTGIVHVATIQTSPFDDNVEYAGHASEKLYACPNVAFSHRLVRVNAMTPTPIRSPQEALGVIALESAMDELAEALSLDPLELRIRNHADGDPSSGVPWSSKRLLECYELGAERFGWAGRSPAPRSMTDGNLLVGWGMASAYHPQYRLPAAALARLLADGTAVVQSGTQEIGTGTYTVMSQVAADALGLPVERVRFELGDTLMPEAPLSAGSMTVASVGPAVHAACLAARGRLIQLAIGDEQSPLFSADESSIQVEDGRLFLADDPSRGETCAEILTRSGLDAVEEVAQSQPGDEMQRFSINSFGAVFAEVKVDPDLGLTRVTRLLGVYDVGRVLNPKTAGSQMIGGIIWGMSQALLEQTVTDRRFGRILNPNLSHYLVPVHADVPEIEVHFIDAFDDQAGPLGTKNVGEIPTIGTPAAIANAVYHATGRRIRDFPISLDKLL